MEKVIHQASSRGFADHGWLKSCHSFSFANYYDPGKIHFGLLRVLNDDEVAGGGGFGKHPHNNMEIISIPLEGELVHQDTMGNSSIIKKGDVQIMSAGTGVMHSEMNNSSTDPVKFLQIWILPKKENISPRYDQKYFPEEERKNNLQYIVSPEKDDKSLLINQNAWLSRASLDKGSSVDHQLHHDSHGLYIFVLKGKVIVAGEKLGKRDAIGLSNFHTEKIHVKADLPSEVLFIEVPMYQQD